MDEVQILVSKLRSELDIYLFAAVTVVKYDMTLTQKFEVAVKTIRAI
jgi:hypothetical protein